ncbi:hypothetical protein [Methylophaga lonarensis]|uniref:hypothetical protein n=1 Tax=Methylophaga lonarensis TaxID=999151 RepID=UPI003D286317
MKKYLLIIALVINSSNLLASQENSEACEVNERNFGNEIEFYGVFTAGDTFFETLCRLNALDSEIYVEINFSRGAWYGLDINLVDSAYTQSAWVNFLDDEFSEENLRDNPMVSSLNRTKQDGVAQLIDYGLSPGNSRATDVLLVDPVKILVEPIQIAGLEFSAHLYFEPNPGLVIGKESYYPETPKISYKKPNNLCLNRNLSLCDSIGPDVEAYMAYMLVGLELINESVSTQVNKRQILETIRQRFGAFQNEDVEERGTQRTRFQDSFMLVNVRINDSSMRIIYEMDINHPSSPYAEVYSYFKDLVHQDDEMQRESPILDGLDGF